MPRLLRAAERRRRSRTKKQLTQIVPATRCLVKRLGALAVAADHAGGEPELGAVGQGEALVVGGEGLHREHRAEDLLREDLAALRSIDDQGRAEVVRTELGVRARRRTRSSRRRPGPGRRTPAPARRARGGCSGRSGCPRRAGRPGGSARPARANRWVKASAMPSCTSRRVPARHTCPALSYCSIARSTARSRSASSRITVGLLPPSSNEQGVRLSAAARAITLAVGTEPVKQIRESPGSR